MSHLRRHGDNRPVDGRSHAVSDLGDSSADASAEDAVMWEAGRHAYRRPMSAPTFLVEARVAAVRSAGVRR
jgi:hypothetical protein